MAAKDPATRAIATNRRARFDYEVLDTYEAGMVLQGSEVKSLREGRANLKDSYAIVKDGEVFLIGCHISPYPFARGGGHEPERTRKLLLHRHEIERIRAQIEERGRTVIPIRMYFKDGKAKLEIGVAKGKDRYDKRETLKRKQADREMERAMRYRSLD
ncbi:MAG: SsrA-binding protein SmpB [Actinobacteria bacterium]|nr:SsrA-binding protein SmpB [Actinomycetota bacterium]